MVEQRIFFLESGGRNIPRDIGTNSVCRTRDFSFWHLSSDGPFCQQAILGRNKSDFFPLSPPPPLKEACFHKYINLRFEILIV